MQAAKCCWMCKYDVLKPKQKLFCFERASSWGWTNTMFLSEPQCQMKTEKIAADGTRYSEMASVRVPSHPASLPSLGSPVATTNPCLSHVFILADLLAQAGHELNCAAEDGLELQIPLPPPLQCWN